MSLYQLDLATKYNNGDFSINVSHSLNGLYDDLTKLFDNNVPVGNGIVINNNSETTHVLFNFGTNGLYETRNELKCLGKVTTSVGVALGYKLIFNEGRLDETTIEQSTGASSYNTTIYTDTPYNIENGDTPIETLYTLKIEFDNFDETPPPDPGDNDVRFTEIKLWIGDSVLGQKQIISKQFEFNDSVLETKAWNSSRYTGKQLQASTINEFTNGDTTYGKTPVLQNYTRNIYLGSRIVGMNSSSIDDGTLTHFEGFSYITMHEYLTINDDLSITRHSIRGNDETNVKKKGFYRSFYHDFPINSEAEIKLFDETIDDNLKSSYNIFNNSGQLQKMLLVERYDTDNTGSGYGVRYSGSNQLFYATSSTQNDLGAEFTIYNQQLIIDKFFTGSLISTPPAWAGGSNPSGGPATP